MQTALPLLNFSPLSRMRQDRGGQPNESPMLIAMGHRGALIMKSLEQSNGERSKRATVDRREELIPKKDPAFELELAWIPVS